MIGRFPDRPGPARAGTTSRAWDVREMIWDNDYRIEVSACPENPRYYRWTVLEDGRPLDLPSFAYGSAWSAHEAARVALHWHLVLKPLRAPAAVEAATPASVAIEHKAASSTSRPRPPRSAYSPLIAVFGGRRS